MCSVRAWRRKCLIQLQWLKSTLFRPNNLPRLLKTNCVSLYTKTLLLLLGIFFSVYDTTHFSSTMFVVRFYGFLSIVLQPHLFSLRNAPFTFPLEQTLWCFSYSIHTPSHSYNSSPTHPQLSSDFLFLQFSCVCLHIFCVSETRALVLCNLVTWTDKVSNCLLLSLCGVVPSTSHSKRNVCVMEWSARQNNCVL